MTRFGILLTGYCAIAAVVVPLSYQLFAVGLRVPLPWGWLGW